VAAGERPVVRAAGGVVWRRRGDGPGADGPAADGSGGGAADEIEVAVVHRPPPRDDWSLPQGKLDPGERHREAALREVLEETGLRCRLGDKLAEVRYETPRGEDKRVRWWEMTVERDEGFAPNDEIDDLRWVPVPELDRVLTWDTDRGVVRRFLARREERRARRERGRA
jgi:8-oxo-dGTP pyrophosphatase MutT (NUDIX family)